MLMLATIFCCLLWHLQLKTISVNKKNTWCLCEVKKKTRKHLKAVFGLLATRLLVVESLISV